MSNGGMIMRRKIGALWFLLIIFISSNCTVIYGKTKVYENSDKIILIDPGHGGIDGGAKSKNGTIEKDINLAISLKLKTKLEEMGYKVAMTREDDIGLYENGKTVKNKKREDLAKRVELKKITKCDVFISIHQNMFPQSKTKGAQVWYADNEESKKLANIIQESLKKNLDENNHRLSKPACDQYKILRDDYKGASVIVECGFLSNPEEEKNLKDDKYQIRIATAIANAVEQYYSN